MTSLVDNQLNYTASDKGVASINRAELHQAAIPVERVNLFTPEMVGVGSADTTRMVLDLAITYGIMDAKQLSSSRPPDLTFERWVLRLSGLYHLTHATPELMYKAAQGFSSLGSDYKVLAEWARNKACEEKGHDVLALRDIESMGYKAKEVVERLVPPAAVALIDYFTRSVQAPDPIGCVGYCFALERLALGVGEKHIQKVEALLPPGMYATRCLRVHSSVGSDVEHVQESIEMVSRLDAQKRARVVRACYETALLCFSPPKQGYISDAELQNKLRPLKIHNFKH